MTPGEYLRNLRLTNKLSLAELSAKLHISTSLLHYIETDHTPPPTRLYKKYQKIFTDTIPPHYFDTITITPHTEQEHRVLKLIKNHQLTDTQLRRIK